MLNIDGNHLEGGGQILRSSLGLSAITKTPFRITDIRKGRCNPGLKAQHLCCVSAVKNICNATVEGDEINSTSIEFVPKKINSGSYEFDIGTAGSITLTLQSLLLPLMFCGKKSTIKLKGGTDVMWSQPIDYFTEVLLPHLQKYCAIECKVFRRGYFPKGGGEVEIKFRPKFNIYDYDSFEAFRKHVSENTPSIDLTEQGHLIMIKGASHASEALQAAQVSERQADSARQALHALKTDVVIRKEYSKSACPGSGIALWAVYSKNKEEFDFNNPIIIGSDALGEKVKSSEDVGSEAAKRLLEEISCKAPVDEYLADNLIPFLIFGGQFKCAKISAHTLTNISVVKQFCGVDFAVDKENNVISFSQALLQKPL